MLDDKNLEEQDQPTPNEENAESAAEQVEAAAEEVAETVEEAAEAATEAAEEVAETAEEAVEAAAETVEETVEEVAEEAAEAVEEAKETVEETTEAVEEVVEEATEAAAETTEEAVEAATEVAEEVAETAETVKAVAEEATETVEAAAAEAVAETPAAEAPAAEASADDEEDDVEIEVEVPTGATGEAHDDFDWSIDATADNIYSEEERTAMLAEFDQSMSAVQEMEIVSGIVTAINDGDVVLDINFKSDGLIPLSEFRDMPDMAVGDNVEVYVEQQEDARGQLVLSRRKAKLLRAWDAIKDSYENGTVIKGTVISKTKGGLIADCGGLETFLPGSQIDIKPIIDYDSYVGKTMEFKVVKINEAIKNAVVSHKALIESDLAEQREAIIASLERGQVLEGLVKNLTDFGAF
ncbi:MAG: S1 RNA-binding domain-containing protein, partial [Bacteroidota bacterium]